MFTTLWISGVGPRWNLDNISSGPLITSDALNAVFGGGFGGPNFIEFRRTFFLLEYFTVYSIQYYQDVNRSLSIFLHWNDSDQLAFLESMIFVVYLVVLVVVMPDRDIKTK